MANLNLRRPSSKDKDTVGRFKPDGRCKKHPKHRQSPGVCSLCLRDKLVQLSASSSSRTTSATAGSSCSSSASSLSSYYSSSSGSSCASPLHHPFPLTTEGKRSFSISLLSSKQGLVKSRSMAVAPRGDGEGSAVNKKSEKKSGFWSKLLRPRSKRMEEKDAKVLVRSRTVRETVNVAS